MSFFSWWAHLMGKDEKTEAARAAFKQAVQTPTVGVALDDVLAKAERVAIAARRQARMTPPPVPRLAPMPSIPEDA